METVLRGASIYCFLLLLFRITGRHSVAEMTQFDFVLVLILGEATQQALLGDDFSVTNCFVVVLTLIALDFLIAQAKTKFPRVERWLDGVPVMLIRDGVLRREALDRERINEQDILEAARESHGLENLDDIQHAILEKSGTVSIVPRRSSKT